MSLYTIIAIDKTDSPELRKATREKHLEYLTAAYKAGKVFTAGPMKNEDGSPYGSLLILEFNTLSEAEEWVTHDPYTQAGLFQAVTITSFTDVMPVLAG